MWEGAASNRPAQEGDVDLCFIVSSGSCIFVGLFMSSGRDENIAKEFVKKIQNYIFQYKVSHLESKGQHTERESWRTRLLMSRQN